MSRIRVEFEYQPILSSYPEGVENQTDAMICDLQNENQSVEELMDAGENFTYQVVDDEGQVIYEYE